MTNPELREILRHDVIDGAKALLGATLIKGELRARIVEVEAYRSTDDPASHAFRGPTPRNRVMYGEPGFAYVYFNYGVHWMLNVTAHDVGDAAAVLICAAMPLAGIETMRPRRRGLQEKQLLSGPGKITQAYEITGSDTGIDLLQPDSGLGLEAPSELVQALSGPRIGIAVGKGHDTPWRFVDAENLDWVSASRSGLV